VYASTSALDSVADGARSASPSMITTSRTVPRATRTRRTKPMFTAVGELALVAKKSRSSCQRNYNGISQGRSWLVVATHASTS
jgi:hypothetical protein